MPAVRVVACAIMLVVITSVADAAEYQGYVPKGLAVMGEMWPGADSADILGCQRVSPSTLKASLNKSAAGDWYGLCAKANRIHAQLVSGHCLQAQQITSECRMGTEADNALRHDRKLWQLVNAMRGKGDDYGLDD